MPAAFSFPSGRKLGTAPQSVLSHSYDLLPERCCFASLCASGGSETESEMAAEDALAAQRAAQVFNRTIPTLKTAILQY